jgi:hypothetical protein
VKRIDQESFKRTRSSSSSITNEKAKSNQSISTSRRKHPQKQQSTELNSSKNDLLTNKHRKQSIMEENSTNNQSKITHFLF